MTNQEPKADECAKCGDSFRMTRQSYIVVDQRLFPICELCMRDLVSQLTIV